MDILFLFLHAVERYKLTRITAASIAISVEFVGMCWSPRGFSPPFVKLIFRYLRVRVMARTLLTSLFVQTSQNTRQ